MPKAARPRIKHRLAYHALRIFIPTMLWLPYETRLHVAAWLAKYIVSPLLGFRRRIRANLAHVFPDMPKSEVERICRKVPDNLGRGAIELLSGAEFARRAAVAPIEGPGLAAIEEARRQGRPVVLVTGHLGNYDAGRAALLARGFRVGALYRPTKNEAANRLYVSAIEAIGKPLFPRSRAGMAGMVRFLREGGVLGIALDQRAKQGAVDLDFLGKPASTSLSAAELALKYDALVIPAYGLRLPDGVNFRVVLEAPVPHGDAVGMTQALNDSLAAQIRGNMDQWLWVYWRWKRI